ncbi:hypothetical protein D5H75_11610 [Bailinhaonella thermotolerans]|uniref:Uncharacterized protein n=1 Tax=Bailinhaonella thermotolerans TaxID=1070861 RepID=A0A3A4B0G1_9ACTN|nr:hypothetical protein D5H75_11610 [Bailinhaonella thermotolerans]
MESGVQLALDTELGALAMDARVCVPLRRAHELAVWVGEGRDLTPSGVLAVSAAADAIQTLGYRPPVAEPDLDLRQETLFAAPVDDGRDLARRCPELMRAWSLALAVGFLRRDGRRVLPGRQLAAWPDGDDAQAVAVWRAAYDALTSLRLETGEITVEFAHALPAVPALLAADDPTPLSRLREGLAYQLANVCDDDGRWRRYGEAVGTAVARLAEFGAVTVEGATVHLTPLGRRATAS